MRTRGWGRKKAKGRGFTLIEVVVTMGIVALSIVALLSGFLSGLMLVESGRNMASAGADARAVFEEMRRVSSNGLGVVTTTPWASWARGAGLTTLPNETVAVSFRNPSADPVEATVTIGWTEKTRNRTVAFTGLVTKR